MSCMWSSATIDIRDKKQKVLQKMESHWLTHFLICPHWTKPQFKHRSGQILFTCTCKCCKWLLCSAKWVTTFSVKPQHPRTRLSWFLWGVWFDQAEATKIQFFFSSEKRTLREHEMARIDIATAKIQRPAYRTLLGLQGFTPKIAVGLFGVLKINLYGNSVSNTGQLSHHHDCKFCPAN